MSNFMQTLFNTNHDQPTLLVFVVLAIIAFVIPSIARYVTESRKANGTAKTTTAASKGSANTKQRHQHKKKKR